MLCTVGQGARLGLLFTKARMRWMIGPALRLVGGFSGERLPLR